MRRKRRKRRKGYSFIEGAINLLSETTRWSSHFAGNGRFSMRLPEGGFGINGAMGWVQGEFGRLICHEALGWKGMFCDIPGNVRSGGGNMGSRREGYSMKWL